MDNERRRLYSILDEWVDQPVDDEVRLRHFAVYLLANQVSFEPYVYWTLLQHFSIFALQAQKRYVPLNELEINYYSLILFKEMLVINLKTISYHNLMKFNLK